MIQNTLYFRNTIWGSIDKEVLGMEFEKWLIKIKKHGLEHTMS